MFNLNSWRVAIRAERRREGGIYIYYIYIYIYIYISGFGFWAYEFLDFDDLVDVHGHLLHDHLRTRGSVNKRYEQEVFSQLLLQTRWLMTTWEQEVQSTVSANNHTSGCGGMVQFSIWEQLLHRNVQRCREGLVFKAHILLYYSTLGLRVIHKKKKKKRFSQMSLRTTTHRATEGWFMSLSESPEPYS